MVGVAFYEKYKPKCVADILGDKRATSEIMRLLANFSQCKYKCILVTGTHGSGKTCRVDTVLRELKYSRKQFDISKFKQAEKPEHYIRELTACSNITTLFGCTQSQKCAIVIDEIDTELLALEKNQLINLMNLNNKTGLCPIIFIFDTKHNKLITSLRKGSYEVVIEEPTDEDMMDMVKKICYYEKIRIKNTNVAERLIKFSQHDFRRLCMTLYDITRDIGNAPITIDVLDKYSDIMKEKDISLDLFRSTNLLLHNYKNIDDCLRLYEVEKVKIPLMVHQNYMNILDDDYKKISKNDIEQIANSISCGDVIDNYIYGEQRWDITNVHGFFTCSVPSYILRNSNNIQYSKPKFPVDMNKTSIKKLNKKNIINASKIFNSADPFDYVYMSRLLTSIIADRDFDKLITIMKTYKLSLDKLENILKIDKNNQYKLTLTQKQKKLLSI